MLLSFQCNISALAYCCRGENVIGKYENASCSRLFGMVGGKDDAASNIKTSHDKIMEYYM